MPNLLPIKNGNNLTSMYPLVKKFAPSLSETLIACFLEIILEVFLRTWNRCIKVFNLNVRPFDIELDSNCFSANIKDGRKGDFVASEFSESGDESVYFSAEDNVDDDLENNEHTNSEQIELLSQFLPSPVPLLANNHLNYRKELFCYDKDLLRQDSRDESGNSETDIQCQLCIIPCKPECKSSWYDRRSEMIVKKIKMNFEKRKLNWQRLHPSGKFIREDSFSSQVSENTSRNMAKKIVNIDSKSFAPDFQNDLFDHQEDGREAVNMKKMNWQEHKLPYNLNEKNNPKNSPPDKPVKNPVNHLARKITKKDSESLVCDFRDNLFGCQDGKREANDKKKRKWIKFKLPSKLSLKDKSEKISRNCKTEGPCNKCKRKMAKKKSASFTLDFWTIWENITKAQ